MIAPGLLSEICTMLADGTAQTPQVAALLREAFPGTPFSVCSDNDIPSRIRPLATGEGFALYGLNTTEHCAALTSASEHADGIVIGLTDDEE